MILKLLKQTKTGAYVHSKAVIVRTIRHTQRHIVSQPKSRILCNKIIQKMEVPIPGVASNIDPVVHNTRR